MIDSLFIADDKHAKIIIEKHWKTPALDTNTILNTVWNQKLKPIIKLKSITIFLINSNGLLIFAIVTSETPPLGVFYFLEQLLELFQIYFGSVNESILRDNFSIIYQLLEEWVDSGMPYITEPALLKQLVPPPSLYTTVMNAVSIAQSTPSAPISMVTSCPWRSTGTKYAHNEIFFDINEELDCIMDQFGNLISGGIFGQIECISKLSGMPHLLLTLGNRKLLPQGSIGFHHCVEIDKFDSNGTISFIPPDGQFVLLDYSLDLMPQQIPLIVKPTLSKTLTGIKIDVSITPRISHDKTFESLTIKAHLPNASSVSFSSSFGVCSFDQISQTFMWDLNGYNTKEITKRPSVTITVNGVSSTGSIYDFHTDFRINMSNLTGIRIDALSVHAESYKPFKGGRSMVKTGRFQTRFRF